MSKNNSTDIKTDLLSCLQMLIDLAQQKKAVLLDREHKRLAGIVAKEDEVLQRMNELRANNGYTVATNDEETQQFAQMASAVAQLKSLNELNADLVKEHLQNVDVCLSLLEQALTDEYEESGNPKGKGKTFPGIINMQA
jgi:hypothetical protein